MPVRTTTSNNGAGPTVVVSTNVSGFPIIVSTISSSSSTPTSTAPSTGDTNPFTGQSSTSSTNEKGSNIGGGAIAGAAIGALAVGAAFGFLLAFLLLKKRHRRKMQALESQMETEKYSGDSPSPSNNLMYNNPALEKELKDGKARIKALEVERNAASAFGDKLDGKTEQELLDSPSFGLSVYNEKVDQIAMSLSVSASGLGPNHEVILPTGLGAAGTEVLKGLDRHQAHSSFEAVVCHVVNSIIYERICTPFCFVASEENKGKSLNKISKDVSKQFNQAMFARWRSMTHSGLQKGCKDVNGKTSISTVQQDIFNSLAEAMVWSGMELDIDAAVIKVSKVHNRLGDSAAMMSKLMNTIREEMTTANYEVMASSKSLNKSLGLSASTSDSSDKSRVVVAPK